MNINLTLIGQMITFTILVWVTMRYVWPPIMDAMDERRERIEQGEQAAQEATSRLSDAKEEAEYIVQEAHQHKNTLITDAESTAKQLIQAGREEAVRLAERLAAQAADKRTQQASALQAELQSQFASLVLDATETLLKQKVDAHAHEAWTNEWLEHHE